MPDHSKYSPSSSHIWLACPGSVALAATVPAPPTSEFALEGTVAHEILHKYFHDGIPIDQWSKIKGVKITAGMKDAIQFAIDEIENCRFYEKTDHLWPLLYSEQKIKINKELYGTADIIIKDNSNEFLAVIDYKHGQGIEVEVENNSQLAYYAVGALKKFGLHFDRLEIMIIQPRIPSGDKVKTWTIENVKKFYDKWNTKILQGVAACKKHPDRFNAGEHCRFCRGAPICDELHKRAIRTAQIEFDDRGGVQFPDPESLSIKQLLKVLDNLDVIKSYLKSVESFAFQMIQSGKKLRGYKLVQRRSQRKWINANLAEKYLIDKVGYRDSIFNTKLKSPAQIEKYFEEKNLNLKELNTFIHKPETGITLADDFSDARPKVDPFADFEE